MKTMERVVLLPCDAILIEAGPGGTRMEIIHLILIWVRIRIRPKLRFLPIAFKLNIIFGHFVSLSLVSI